MSDGLIIADGSQAYKIREIAMVAGMPKYWADYASELWKVMSPGERKVFAGGLTRSAGYAMGIDIVNPEGVKLINQVASGTRTGERYAPYWLNTVAIQGAARRKISAENPKATPKEIDRLVSLEVEQTIKTADMQNPAGMPFDEPAKFSVDGSTEQQDAAIYLYQMTDRISLGDFPTFSEMSMRQSYLSAILGQGPYFSVATDYWTLGTIGGPRFFLRNGIEDAGLYALTGGSWQGFRQGQMWSKSKREATMRPDYDSKSKKNPGDRLGLFFTGTRYLGDVLPQSLRTIILPHLNALEIKTADAMAKVGDRAGLVDLISKAYMRRQGMGIMPGTKLNKDTLRYLDEGVEDPMFFNIMDNASESTSDLLTSQPAGSASAEINRLIMNGELRYVNAVMIPSKETTTNAQLDAVRGWLTSIMNIVNADGVYGPKAISLIERKNGYHKAVYDGNVKLQNKIIKEYADFIEANLDKGMESSAIYGTLGAEEMARRKLNDALRIFSKNDGSLNKDVLRMISSTDEDGVKSYATYRDSKTPEEIEKYGSKAPSIDELTLSELQLPYSTMQEGIDFASPLIPVTSNGQQITKKAWNAMGRSLARFTREPIFIANYIEARKFIQPIETRLSAEFGEEYAKKWAVRNGYERAFNLTMAYVDNPQIRSQMAWSVRNVSRFYRAQEDFFRRMMRVGKNNPLAIEKLNLSWHALDEIGFVNENEYGEKIFTWPANKPITEAVNFVTEKALARNVLEGAALVNFNSSITRLSPSADPDAIPYTLSGPYSAVALPALMYFFPGLKVLQEELAGDMSVGRSWMEAAIPTNFKNLLDLFTATLGEETLNDREGRGADSARSAIQVYAATGRLDQQKLYSDADLFKLKKELNVLGTDISILKSISGPTMPASVNVSADQVSSFAKSIGITGFRTIYTKLLELNDGDQNAALVQFTAANPGLSIFTVSKNTGANNFGNFGATKETQEFIEDNMEMFKENSSGLSFFAPRDGITNIEAWRYLRAQGATIPERVEYFFNEMLTADGYGKYRIEADRHSKVMKELSKQLSMLSPYQDVEIIKLVKKDMAEARAVHTIMNKGLYADYEMLESRISGGLKTSSLTSSSDDKGFLKDVEKALVYMESKKNVDEKTKVTRELFNGYEETLTIRRGMNRNDAQYRKNNIEFKADWSSFLSPFKDMYPEDSQWESLINSMNGSLNVELI